MRTTTARDASSVDEVPLQAPSLDIWDSKYRLKDRHGRPVDADPAATRERVARALAAVEEDAEAWLPRFRWALDNGAIPAGRIVANAGAEAVKPAVSLINCTVSRTLHDSMRDILEGVVEAGMTLKAGCVSPDTRVVTERGVVSAKQAVRERHGKMLCYDRDSHRFEMRNVERHMTTHVPRDENIELISHGASLKTSIRHPVLVHRGGRLTYVPAGKVMNTDGLVHYALAWSADASSAQRAWFAGAHLGDGSAYAKHMVYKATRTAWAARARAAGQRLIFKIRAAEREVVERYARFFEEFCGSRARVVETATPNGTPVWDYTVSSFAASEAVTLIDGQVGKKSRNLRIPVWVSQQPERHFLPFLAGLVDTDGTVSKERGSVSVAAQDGEFLSHIKSLLGLFGVNASVTHRQPREHQYQGNLIRDTGGFSLKISDSAFLKTLARYMADSGKRQRIHDHASTAGQYDRYQMPPALREALTGEAERLGHRERQTLGFYHGYHRRDVISRVWLDKWEQRFPQLKPLLDFARCLRPLEAIKRELDIGETFYDFTVEGHHNYLAGSHGLMVIHNCGIGYDFSTLRPRGAFVFGAGAGTNGPLAFMDIYDRMCFTVASAGGRRGAQMATFDVGHPDVRRFIEAKREAGRLRQFNLSLLITDEFLEAVRADADWPLAFPLHPAEKDDVDESELVYRDWPAIEEGYPLDAEGRVACRVVETVRARELWDTIMRSTYDYAEPGFILIDQVNRMNNNWFCEEIRATNPCVTADTRLHTQFGQVPIGDLYRRGEELRVTVDKRALCTGERGVETRPAVPAFMTARQADVYRVTTREGYEVKATEWHEFYTQRGKIPLKDLRVEDRLWVQSGKGQFGDQGDERLGVLLGLIAGDGHFTHRGNGHEAVIVNFWESDRTLADITAEYINELIADSAKTSRRYRVAPVAVAERRHVFIRSVILARLLAHYGFTRDTKLKVPEVVWRGTEECVKGYLRGLFQADGTVQRDDKNAYCTIRLASSEPGLLKDVQVLLSNFGIFCRILKRRAAGKRWLPDGKGGSREYQCQADYELLIGSESRDRFMHEIGFLSDTKNQKYQEWQSMRSSAIDTAFLAEVTAIEYVGREAVFDTTQGDKNNLVFNGLVTGNCGEQPLPPEGACLLGSINLTRFVLEPFGEVPCFDWERYRRVVAIFTRMLDNVVEISGLPLDGQRREIEAKRRHGMGFLGLGSALTMLKLPYGSPESLAFTEEVSRVLAVEGWRQALALAREKGMAPVLAESFELTPRMLRERPELVQDGYQPGDRVPGRTLHARYSRYMQKIAEVEPDLVAELAEHGARFTHHSSIAPTGTISLSLGNNASNGIEPSFSHRYFRNVIRAGRKTKEQIEVVSFELAAYRHRVAPEAVESDLPDYFVTADGVSPAQHVAVQAAAQAWIDSAISKTVNVPTEFAYEDFQDLYLNAYDSRLKGCTTFRFNPEAFQGVLVREDDLKNTVYVFELENGERLELSGDETVIYEGEAHTAANLHEALKEGTYGKW